MSTKPLIGSHVISRDVIKLLVRMSGYWAWIKINFNAGSGHYTQKQNNNRSNAECPHAEHRVKSSTCVLYVWIKCDWTVVKETLY